MLIVTTDMLKSKHYDEIKIVSAVSESADNFETAINALEDKAREAGADAIIGLKFQPMDGNKVLLVGTCVKYVEKTFNRSFDNDRKPYQGGGDRKFGGGGDRKFGGGDRDNRKRY